MHVNVTRVNKIEASYEVSCVRVNGKVELGSPFRSRAPFMHFLDEFEPPEKEFVLEQKRPIGLVLQDNITISSIWTSRLGRLP